jgi:hypothetical protein
VDEVPLNVEADGRIGMRQWDDLQLEPYVYFLHVLTELSQHAPNANASKLLPLHGIVPGGVGAVNFPHVSPGPLSAPARLLNVHGNVPGALATLNTRLAGEGSNIVAQHLQTRGETGYVVTDLDRVLSKELIESLSIEPGFVRSRLLIKSGEQAGSVRNLTT